MELAYRINEAFKDGRNPLWKELNQLSIDVFNTPLDGKCTSCIPDLIKRLKRFALEKMPNKKCKYRFSKKWKDKKVVVTIGGTSHIITAETLSNATAEAILNSGAYRNDIIELNPDYDGTDVVKKNLVANLPEPQPLLSISKEVKNDGKQSKQTANAKK
jgi:hypothetical protein